MSHSAESWVEQLKGYRQQFIGELPEQLDQITETWRGLSRSAWNSPTCNNLYRLVHGIAGTAATLGFNRTGKAARALEYALEPFATSTRVPSAQEAGQIDVQLAVLQRAGAEFSVTPRLAPTRENKLIYFYHVGSDVSHDLGAQVDLFGYSARHFERLPDLVRAIDSASPAAIIMDGPAGEENAVPAEAVSRLQPGSELRAGQDAPIPLLFISSRGDMPTRLEAVRAGAGAFLVKPVDVTELIDRLDLLTARPVPDPFRILIVEPAADVSEEVSRQLEAAGMKTLVVAEPLRVIEPLLEFNPDLILVEMYLPDCTGLELAAVIRQQRDFVSIPIVYVSADDSLDTQLQAMRLGGDDLLRKPIQPQLLIASVITRSQRSRLLRAYMIRDSLTDLLNHTATKERLDLEIARAGRQGTEVAYAMIDIDHFKAVNDTYGHSAGDGVLKSLAHVLQQRLRKTDAIGRYGGEEFAVILPDTRGENAFQVLDSIRTGFGQLRHRSESTEFAVTFSCGIASFPLYSDAARLSDTADKALYEAKDQGRNQVVLAGAPR